MTFSQRDLRDGWLYYVRNITQVSQSITKGSDCEDHEAYSDDPEGNKDALLPEARLLFCCDHIV
jgi:hypothetical protein